MILGKAAPYCASRYSSIRRFSRVVNIGSIATGGENPVRIQSMTTTNTLDVKSTVEQTIELAEAGCEIVRITAPNVRAAEALGEISKKVRSAGIEVPLVADIHFMPSAAMEAVKHVEKVRINPGNYADRKKFQIREYSESQYEEELDRLYESFSPLVLRCMELGRSLRIGTNHGSLSDRIMNRFGDTPRGMAESALEFLRIARFHGYHQIILSMKSSNPKVMIQAYRLVVSMMNEEDMHYPLHLGVTEAGDGEDARIKSSIGIGSLLLDGLGDTIRVSLTEDPVHEIPVARDLVRRAHAWWRNKSKKSFSIDEKIDPFSYSRRSSKEVSFGLSKFSIGDRNPPSALVPTDHPLSDCQEIIRELASVQVQSKDARVEGLMVVITQSSDLSSLQTLACSIVGAVAFMVVLDEREDHECDEIPANKPGCVPLIWFSPRACSDESSLARFLTFCEVAGHQPALAVPADRLNNVYATLLANAYTAPILTLDPNSSVNPVAGYRILAASLSHYNLSLPIWIRDHESSRFLDQEDLFSGRLLDASILIGALLCDGIGDLVSVENAGSLNRNRGLVYNLMQGARARITKTEFIACPSCGRTLFDLQSTTQKVKAATGHLKGVTIAVMGCIVNGPGEMADADFGYVGSGPGKIDLYVGKERVKSAIPESEAVDRLIELIQEENRWIDPKTT